MRLDASAVLLRTDFAFCEQVELQVISQADGAAHVGKGPWGRVGACV